ncbi:hypothetical protein PN441_00265 [Spirulina major CS-329]|nr:MULTISPECIES: hypothetical protein [Spirulina]MDB9501489.1 hypothetical protein [Spirulina major CS-329]
MGLKLGVIVGSLGNARSQLRRDRRDILLKPLQRLPKPLNLRSHIINKLLQQPIQRRRIRHRNASLLPPRLKQHRRLGILKNNIVLGIALRKLLLNF